MFFKNLSSKLRKPGLTELLAILVFIVFIPSFFVSDEIMNGTRMAKEFGLSITLAIVLPIALVLWTIYNFKDISIGITKIDILVAIFAAYCGFLVWYHGYTDRIEIKFFMYGSAYILFRIFFSSFKQNTHPEYSWKNPRVYFPVLLSLILSVHCIIGQLQLYGVMNSYHAYFKVTGMFFNPAPYSGFLIALSPLCIATYMEMKKYKEKWGNMEKVAANLLLVSFILTLSVLPITQSRAAWVAFVGAMVFLVWRYYPVKEWWATYFPKTWMKVTGISLAAILLVSTAAGLYYFKKDSADGRLLIWKVSGDVIKENPIIGTGLGKFAVNYGKAQIDYFKNGRGSESEKWVADNVYFPFNEVLRILVEMGIIGFLIILAGVVVLLLLSSRNKSIEELNFRFIIIPIILFGLFSYPFTVPFHIIILIIGIVGGVMSFKNRKIKIHRNILLTLIITSTGFSLVLGSTIGNNYSLYKNWNTAFKTYNIGDYSTSNEIYKFAYNGLKYNHQYLLNYGKSLSMSGEYSLSSDILKYAESININDVLLNTQAENLKNLKRNEQAVIYYKKSCDLIPNRLYPRYLLVNYYWGNKEKYKAIKLAKEILNMKAKVNSTAVKQIKSEMEGLILEYNKINN